MSASQNSAVSNHSIQLRLALPLTIAAALLIVLHPVFNYDIYWHLAYGREMSRLGEVVTADFLSFTAQGVEFTNREWLSQWIFYQVQDALGWGGLLGLKLVISALIALLVYRTATLSGSVPWMASLATVLAVLA